MMKQDGTNTMENLDTAALQYLAGVKKTIEECGMMGGIAPQPHMPATINVTANSADELSGMLKDLMGLAGVHKVEPHHMPVDNPTSGPSKVISSPPMKAEPHNEPDMKALLSVMDAEPEVDEDSMNPESDEQRMYSSSPHEKGKGWGSWAMDGDQNNRVVAAKDELVNREDITAESLWAKYNEFINENKDCNCTPKGEKCPVHGMKACECYVGEEVSNKQKTKLKLPQKHITPKKEPERYGKHSTPRTPIEPPGIKTMEGLLPRQKAVQQTLDQEYGGNKVRTGKGRAEKQAAARGRADREALSKSGRLGSGPVQPGDRATSRYLQSRMNKFSNDPTEVDEGKKWVQKAVKGIKRGALRKQEGKKKGEKFSKSELKGLAKSGTALEKKRAQFALNISEKKK